jgi:hypothetical protein
MSMRNFTIYDQSIFRGSRSKKEAAVQLGGFYMSQANRVV